MATSNVESTIKSRYLLPSDKPESIRLNLQDRMLKRAFGDIVFAPVTFDDDDVVLDSGTGTASWILDCYDTFKPAVKYYGVDISSNLYPVLDDSLRSRIHLTQGNILKPEGEWAERSYKLVNQRLLVAALSAEDWKVAIGNIYKLLSHGGWVQLVEANHCYSGEATERHRALLRRIFEKRGLLLDPVYSIPALLQEAGFVEVNKKGFQVNLGKWAGEDGVDARNACIGVYRGMRHPVVNVLGLLSSSEFDSHIDQMEQEWDSTEGSEVRYNIFYAQKPAGA